MAYEIGSLAPVLVYKLGLREFSATQEKYVKLIRTGNGRTSRQSILKMRYTAFYAL
jgi:hypothetical protein